MNCVCCTKARWWHGTSAVTSVASCSCCPSITWPRCLRQRPQQQTLTQAFDAWGPEARAFHLELNRRPLKSSVHVRRLLSLAKLYGRGEVLAAIRRALELATYDAAYVENLLLAQRRRRQLPTPTLPTPKRRELIDDIEPDHADPALYERFCHDAEENQHGTK